MYRKYFMAIFILIIIAYPGSSFGKEVAGRVQYQLPEGWIFYSRTEANQYLPNIIAYNNPKYKSNGITILYDRSIDKGRPPNLCEYTDGELAELAKTCERSLKWQPAIKEVHSNMVRYKNNAFVITKYITIHDDTNNPLIHYQILTKFDGTEYQVWTQCREYPTSEATELTRQEFEPIVLTLLESMELIIY